MQSHHIEILPFRYGDDVAHAGNLYLPDRRHPPVVCLLHGGFWRMPYGFDQLDAIARELATQGLAVWNLEYRRVGAPGGGFPGTLLDVDAGIDFLCEISARNIDIDLGRVIVAGHSAGGHLALWSAARRRSGLPVGPGRVQPIAVVGLAPICNLENACRSGAGAGAVEAFIGGPPWAVPDRYKAASPLSLLPFGLRQLVIHGAQDEALPASASRDYVDAARAAGDQADFLELADAGHMDFIDPSSDAFEHFGNRLTQLLR